EHSERTPMSYKRYVTTRLKSLSNHTSSKIRIDPLNVRPGEQHWLSFHKRTTGRGIFYRNRETFLQKACCAPKIECVDFQHVAVGMVQSQAGVIVRHHPPKTIRDCS